MRAILASYIPRDGVQTGVLNLRIGSGVWRTLIWTLEVPTLWEKIDTEGFSTRPAT
jgi:hypothetical protein